MSEVYTLKDLAEDVETMKNFKPIKYEVKKPTKLTLKDVESWGKSNGVSYE